MRRRLFTWSWLAVLGVCVMNEEVSAKPPLRAYTIRGVAYEVDRPADGKKYPNPIKERYELTSTGQLKYSAYFGNMPIDMNHMDSITWESAAAGRKVLDAIAALLLVPSSGLKELPDSRPTPTGAYLVQLTRDGGDSTQYVDDPHSRAWAVIHSAFGALRGEFEHATGRPKKPDQLPQ